MAPRNSTKSSEFQSTPPARGATTAKHSFFPMWGISIHAPREGGDETALCGLFQKPPISIHAPREGGDVTNARMYDNVMHFNPRPPRGGRRSTQALLSIIISDFNPRPPRGGRPHGDRRKVVLSGISIHAPREGGRLPLNAFGCLLYDFNPRPPRGGRRNLPVGALHLAAFQSTPPARGATQSSRRCSPPGSISIHAPREGGDINRLQQTHNDNDFNPRPPRGGRLPEKED